jgi:hypothetical protein
VGSKSFRISFRRLATFVRKVMQLRSRDALGLALYAQFAPIALSANAGAAVESIADDVIE